MGDSSHTGCFSRDWGPQEAELESSGQGFRPVVNEDRRALPGLPTFGQTGTPTDVTWRGDFRQEVNFPFSFGQFRFVPYVLGRYTVYSESTEEYVRRRHDELQTYGMKNPKIFAQIRSELATMVTFIAETAAALFYRRLFELDPGLRVLAGAEPLALVLEHDDRSLNSGLHA